MSETPEINYTAWLEQLRVEVAESVNGVMLRGARVVPVGVGGTARPTSRPGSVVGYSLRNLTAAPITVYLREGRDASGSIIVAVRLGADAAETFWFGPGGLNIIDALFIDAPAASLEGAVYLRGVD